MSDEKFGYHPNLPEEIREIFMWLCQDVAELHQSWNFYLELFDDEKNVALMNDFASASFHIIEQALRRDITMAISRLDDPAKTRYKDKRNLSLKTLVNKCKHILNVKPLYDEFHDACEPVRDYRNKRVGHRDLDATIEPVNLLFTSIGRGQIEEILELAGKLLDTIHEHYVGVGFDFKPFALGGADTLIHALNLMKKEREDRLRKLHGDNPT